MCFANLTFRFFKLSSYNLWSIKLKLNYELLNDEQYNEYPLDYKSCFNARGLYHSMQFVLRLRPDIHNLLDATENGIHTSNKYDFETIQAFSTYLHETIHWWQHIGSISGLILSFSYPAQAHINHSFLKEYIKHTGLKKPITKYNVKNIAHAKSKEKEFLAINPILNNFHDIEFFKNLIIEPKSAPSFINDKLFESVGHSFHIAYSSFVAVLSASFDRNLNFLPNAKDWHVGFDILQEKKEPNHCYGEPAYISSIGLIELYEGQARFTQMQYLFYSSGEALEWKDFEDLGMLDGIYYSAFNTFLTLTESERPEDLGSPLVALFLLVLDIAINPGEGFPFEIEDYKKFIDSTNPGIRFMNLCKVIKNKHPEFKTLIIDYSTPEYYHVSTALSAAIDSHSPLDIAGKICHWVDNENSLIELMKEEQSFEFQDENLPIRLLFSRFIRFQQDKLRNPSYFCWTGFYSAGKKVTDESLTLFQEHQSLFTDKSDGDIYPRKFPEKDEAKVQKTFDTFYAWVAMYDLCRQWIVGEGDFDYDYFWLSSKYSRSEFESWARNHFKLVYGVDPSDFEIVF